MGPRHLSRGNELAVRLPSDDVKASMGPRHLSRGNPVRIQLFPPQHHRFNGATASQPWKSPGPKQEVPPLERLQWGHGISAVEIR